MPTFASTEDHVAAGGLSYDGSVLLDMATRDCRRRIDMMHTLDDVSGQALKVRAWGAGEGGTELHVCALGCTRPSRCRCETLRPRPRESHVQVDGVGRWYLQAADSEDSDQSRFLSFPELQTPDHGHGEEDDSEVG